jgi:adenylosuccinate synthase
LQRYFNLPAVEFKRTLEEQLAFAERLRPLLLDVTGTLARLHDAGANVLFEGAQGAMLDVDVGTYPFVTSSNTTAGGAATGTGLGPRYFDHVIGIVKAYATRVGAGPFPTELFDDYGEHMSKVGHEFGSVTGRRRRCGWFDAVALRRTVVNSSVSGLCMTKLDVLDGLDQVRICTGYRYGGAISAEPPVFADAVAEVEPVYEDLPGWQESTAGVCKYAALPAAARRYLERVQEILEVPVDMISTGPDRDHTIVLRPPFAG